LAAGLRLDPLGELKCLPEPLAAWPEKEVGIKEGRRRGEGRQKGTVPAQA